MSVEKSCHTQQIPSHTLAELAKRVGGQFRGDGDFLVKGIASLEKADATSLSFITDHRYLPKLAITQAGVVILTESLLTYYAGQVIIVADPYYAYAQIAACFEYHSLIDAGIHKTVVVGDNTHIASSAPIGPYCVIGRDVKIGEQTVIGAHCVIEDGVILGDECKLHPRVTLLHHVVIGHKALIQSGVVIGSDGFGNARSQQGQWLRIPQLGRVIVQDCVEIGANTTIDRGTIENTEIARGVRLDNLIQIAHNVKIGENTAIAAGVGIAGSTTIGKNCLIGGLTGISGHITLTDNVMLTGMSMVTASITESGVYSSGTGLLPNKLWRRNVVRFRQLESLFKKIFSLDIFKKMKE